MHIYQELALQKQRRFQEQPAPKPEPPQPLPATRPLRAAIGNLLITAGHRLAPSHAAPSTPTVTLTPAS